MTDSSQDCMNFEHAAYKAGIVLLCANPFSKDIFETITARHTDTIILQRSLLFTMHLEAYKYTG